MYDPNSSSDFRTLRTEQHVSLQKHQHMIENTLRWQQATKSVKEQPSRVTLYVHRIFSFLLRLIGVNILPKRKRKPKPKQYKPCTSIECVDCC